MEAMFLPKNGVFGGWKFKEKQTKNSEETAQFTEQTRTESVLTLQGRGPIDYTTITNPTYQKG